MEPITLGAAPEGNYDGTIITITLRVLTQKVEGRDRLAEDLAARAAEGAYGAYDEVWTVEARAE